MFKLRVALLNLLRLILHGRKSTLPILVCPQTALFTPPLFNYRYDTVCVVPSGAGMNLHCAVASAAGFLSCSAQCWQFPAHVPADYCYERTHSSAVPLRAERFLFFLFFPPAVSYGSQLTGSYNLTWFGGT